GKAVTYYRTRFEVTEAMMERGALFLRFKGVDYKAHVFVNGAYLDSHEGFFAPFEVEFTRHAHPGENTLLVKVENDAICMGNASWGADGKSFEGDKIYAATGPGYDDPEVGWHHCPPGMGIYQDVFVEARASLFIHDIFVRPMVEETRAEAWIEVWNCDKYRKNIGLELSVYGQNFRATVFRDRAFPVSQAMGPGVNYFRLSFDMPTDRLWDLDAPWLYQLQAKLADEKGRLQDISARPFGMRSFCMDEESEPRGRMILNNREIRLRGANTMGHLQQCVIKKDWDQLRDDLLLAKICNMNFLRFTQRPVQPEIYEYCDRLGMMTQTDLPLFAVLRRNQFCEDVRQAEEMERLIRAHPCNIMVSYINEPCPNANGNPRRHLTRTELEGFFRAADEVIRLQNPDRVIKPVDGDYDPPADGLPDNHCYCGWYNGHGLDLGRLHKGYWQHVKPGWMVGCGEFGAEGLDPV
ncbi:MAG: glycoside hydrolase family 2, partial [Candidatus Latescibacteria bacterium]|nr:glycoside hydrolase family 2 [Candidatus Latescibacterota bacterium]